MDKNVHVCDLESTGQRNIEGASEKVETRPARALRPYL